MPFHALKEWFLREKRDLPWREDSSPYAVWVSEIMLQQTQVAVVIPYFERWMRQFPSIHALASAPLDVVIKAWEGLGYYSRARNLHQAAQQVVCEFNGVLPEEEEKLSKIKGIGPYTVGAIRAFAFKKRAAAVDGNVLRVLARYYLIEEDIAKPRTVAHMRQLAFDSLPEEEPWVVSEALIELGATLCGRKPMCGKCPLKSSCAAYATGKTLELPYKKKNQTPEQLFRAVALIRTSKNVLLKRAAAHEIMSDLHLFPFVEGTSEANWQQVYRSFQGYLSLKFIQILPQVKHGFTRYRATLFPALFHAEKESPVPGYFWAPLEALPSLAFAAGHRQLVPYLEGTSLK